MPLAGAILSEYSSLIPWPVVNSANLSSLSPTSPAKVLPSSGSSTLRIPSHVDQDSKAMPIKIPNDADQRFQSMPIKIPRSWRSRFRTDADQNDRGSGLGDRGVGTKLGKSVQKRAGQISGTLDSQEETNGAPRETVHAKNQGSSTTPFPGTETAADRR